MKINVILVCKPEGIPRPVLHGVSSHCVSLLYKLPRSGYLSTIFVFIFVSQILTTRSPNLLNTTILKQLHYYTCTDHKFIVT
jgi:hypothetical protein